jgi:16S rRNA (cytidine1402-2'-O)-methyltransferase
MAVVYLIPSVLDEKGYDGIPFYITNAVKDCQVFFVENERTARRYLKQLWKTALPSDQIIIDEYEWYVIDEQTKVFKEKLEQGKNIGIISEAGCPGVADPGQSLIAVAQEMDITIKPLVGPNSILLSLMASGMNGQNFRFHGYLPIDIQQRIKAIKDLEQSSGKNNSTQIFIETPYRNNQMLESLLKNLHPNTKLCLAVDLTGSNEFIKTKTVSNWQKEEKPELHKRPVIFLVQVN